MEQWEQNLFTEYDIPLYIRNGQKEISVCLKILSTCILLFVQQNKGLVGLCLDHPDVVLKHPSSGEDLLLKAKKAYRYIVEKHKKSKLGGDCVSGLQDLGLDLNNLDENGGIAVDLNRSTAGTNESNTFDSIDVKAGSNDADLDENGRVDDVDLDENGWVDDALS